MVVGDDGRSFDLPKRALPRGAREGIVLRLEAGSPPDWSRAVIDDAERQRRLEQARETLRRLGDRDPGGDVTL